MQIDSTRYLVRAKQGLFAFTRGLGLSSEHGGSDPKCPENANNPNNPKDRHNRYIFTSQKRQELLLSRKKEESKAK